MYKIPVAPIERHPHQPPAQTPRVTKLFRDTRHDGAPDGHLPSVLKGVYAHHIREGGPGRPPSSFLSDNPCHYFWLSHVRRRFWVSAGPPPIGWLLRESFRCAG
ncbi:MAG: hypothetical protein NVS4B6_15090 [Mycobacterium sp.]